MSSIVDNIFEKPKGFFLEWGPGSERAPRVGTFGTVLRDGCEQLEIFHGSGGSFIIRVIGFFRYLQFSRGIYRSNEDRQTNRGPS
jgi:hypothetical protein